MGEKSEEFKIKMGVRQGDMLSSLLFDLVLDQGDQGMEKRTEVRDWKPICLGCVKDDMQK